MSDIKVYTFGYVGLKPIDIQAKVEELDAIVVDTRLAPISMAPQWRKRGFQKLLGSRYIHVAAFGNRNYKKKDGSIEIADLRGGLKVVEALLADGLSVMLMCGCMDVEKCHRRVVAGECVTEFSATVVHLSKKDFTATVVQTKDEESGLPPRVQKPVPMRQLNMFGGEDIVAPGRDRRGNAALE